MAQELPTYADNLKNDKGLIDLDSSSDGDFGLDEYTLCSVLDDIILVELIDEVNDGKGDAIKRNGLFVPVNTLTKAWRKAKVVLTGPRVAHCKKDDIVIFPNDKGVAVSGIEIKDYGKIVKGMFLNEQRIFGVCEKTQSKYGD